MQTIFYLPFTSINVWAANRITNLRIKLQFPIAVVLQSVSLAHFKIHWYSEDYGSFRLHARIISTFISKISNYEMAESTPQRQCR